MTLLTRYLLRLHLVPFLYALSALTSILLINQVAKRFGSLVGKGLPWSVIVEVFALSVPFLVAMTIPMAVLVTVLHTFSRLAAEHEITALQAAGVSIYRLTRILLAASVGVALVAFAFSDQILPRTNHRLRTLLMDIDRKKPTLAVKEQIINEVQRNRVFLRAGRIDSRTYRMQDVTIYDLRNQTQKRIIYADSGEMAFTENLEDLQLTLFDGTLHVMDHTDLSTFRQAEFTKNIVLVTGVGNQLQRTMSDGFRGDREMGVCELSSVSRSASREAAVLRRRSAAMRENNLRAIVGLTQLHADTAVSMGRPALYCRVLARLSALFIATPAEAQARTQDTTTESLLRRFDAPARTAFRAGRPPRPRRPPNLRASDLQTLNSRLRQATTRSAGYAVEMHKKYAIAIACIVFVLIAIPVALRFPRGGVGLVIGVSTAVFTVYYVGLIAGEALANRMIVSPGLAMWLTNILFAVVGLVALASLRVATIPTSDRNALLRLFLPARFRHQPN